MGVMLKQIKLFVFDPLAMSNSGTHFCQRALQPCTSSNANEHLAWLSKIQGCNRKEVTTARPGAWKKNWWYLGFRIRVSEGVFCRSHAESEVPSNLLWHKDFCQNLHRFGTYK